MKTALLVGLALSLALMGLGCTLLDDAEPEFEPGSVSTKLFVSTAPVPDFTMGPQAGDVTYALGTLVSARIYPTLGHQGYPLFFESPPPTVDLAVSRLVPFLRAAPELGNVGVFEGDYRCVSGALRIEEFSVAASPGFFLRSRTCTVAPENQVLPFGPVCFPTAGVPPFEVTIAEGVEARPWVDLTVVGTCDVDGTEGTISVAPATSAFNIETEGID